MFVAKTIKGLIATMVLEDWTFEAAQKVLMTSPRFSTLTEVTDLVSNIQLGRDGSASGMSPTLYFIRYLTSRPNIVYFVISEIQFRKSRQVSIELI